MAKAEECVQVVVRCRPLNAKEVDAGSQSQCVKTIPRQAVIEIKNPKSLPTDPPKVFTFDAVFDANSRQEEIYQDVFSGLVDAVLEGYNSTIFAYGQTGTGKTYTMEGIRADAEQKGAIPRSFEHIFGHISNANIEEQYLVRASYLEIYQEEIRDLLCKDQTKRFELKERPDIGVYVKDLSSFVCKSLSEIEHVMGVGNQNRSVGATNMNEHSSRSHAIFIVTVECSRPDAVTPGKSHIRAGKLNLVDLAGSERQAKTGAVGDRLKEATKINLSLSALGNVISSLVDSKCTHVPYRDSKLTRLLQDSLGGNAKTVMVANIGPADYNYEESLTTLRYAHRAKEIKNKPRINEDPKDALLREFQEEIARLKAQLQHKDRGGSGEKRRKRPRQKETPEAESNAIESSSDSLSGQVMTSSSSPEAMHDDLHARLAVERDLLENDTTMLTEEKEKLLSALGAKENALLRERHQHEAMKAKIKALESKLLSGGGSALTGDAIVERTAAQQQMLEQRAAEVRQRRLAERETARQLEEREEMGMEMEKTYSSLQQEVEVKTKKLKKLLNKLQAVKQDIDDVTEEYNRDRRDLEDTQQELLKELKLKCLIIENFIPPLEKQKLLGRAQFDEEEDSWYLINPGQTAANTISKRPVSAPGSRRPMSEYARTQSKKMVGNAAVEPYRGENVMRLSLDVGGRTTRDYEGPAVAPRVQAALDAALLNVEPDIDIDVSALSNGSAVRGTRQRNSKEKKQSRNEQYPSSRGLVPK